MADIKPEEKGGVILVLDVGTTNIKASIVDKNGVILALKKSHLPTTSPLSGYHEIKPDALWADIQILMKEAAQGYESSIAAVGISTHRCSFVTWNKTTDQHLHNFITWSDQRACKMCDDWNNSYVVRISKSILWFLGKLFGSSHMVCAACFTVRPANVQMRLKWVMENVPEAGKLYNQGELSFGTIDTWLVHKLTGGKMWATDYTNAGATGIYDMWGYKWCPFMTTVFSNPIKALPEVRDSNSNFGNVSKELELGFTAPIMSIIADQQASMLGNLLLDKNDFKLTLGTLLSCDLMTESDVHPVAMSVYPQIAWKFSEESICYMAECRAFEMRGKCLDRLLTEALVSSLDQMDSLAASVNGSDWVFFTGPSDAVEFLSQFSRAGLSPAEMVRATLEAHVFRCKTIMDEIIAFYGTPKRMIVDGGASASHFILSHLSALTGIKIYVNSSTNEGALMGAFYLAAVGVGWWKSTDDLKNSVKLSHRLIEPADIDVESFTNKFTEWKQLKTETLGIL